MAKECGIEIETQFRMKWASRQNIIFRNQIHKNSLLADSVTDLICLSDSAQVESFEMRGVFREQNSHFLAMVDRFFLLSVSIFTLKSKMRETCRKCNTL